MLDSGFETGEEYLEVVVNSIGSVFFYKRVRDVGALSDVRSSNSATNNR